MAYYFDVEGEGEDPEDIKACMSVSHPILVLRRPTDRTKSGSVMAMKMISAIMNGPSGVNHLNGMYDTGTKQERSQQIIYDHCGPWLVPHLSPFFNPSKYIDLCDKLEYIMFEELSDYIPYNKGISVDYTKDMPQILWNGERGWQNTISESDLHKEEELYTYIIDNSIKISSDHWKDITYEDCR